jgi:hypothetical protein
MDYARRLLKGKQYSQDDLIPFLILVIGSFKGKAYKSQVDEKMYSVLSDKFSHETLHQTVANNIPRWKHDIAWAKERAKQIHGWIKGAEESGRGVWELTEPE